MPSPRAPQPQQLPKPGVCTGAEQQLDAAAPAQLRLSEQGGQQRAHGHVHGQGPVRSDSLQAAYLGAGRRNGRAVSVQPKFLQDSRCDPVGCV